MLLKHIKILIAVILVINLSGHAMAVSSIYKENLYNTGPLPPTDSRLKVKTGDPAPYFSLPAISGEQVKLSDFYGKKMVMLTFIPAAWTPVCSDQWPGYNIARELFEKYDTTVLGISVDNLPTLHAWTHQMGTLWFEVLSDFWPHGGAADSYGVLRGNGTAERAIFIIDKKGIIRFIHVGDINVRPELGMIMKAISEIHSLEKPSP